METANALAAIQRAMEPSIVSQPLCDTSKLEALTAKGLTTQTECDELRRLALSLPNDGVIPATPAQISARLEWMKSTLPAQNVDDEMGKKRAVVYIQLLSGYSDESLGYMVRRACAELEWLPKPKWCLEVLNQFTGSETLKQKALRKCEEFTQAMFDQFVAELRAGAIPQSQIDAAPERWKRICTETGLLIRTGETYAQRIKIPAD